MAKPNTITVPVESKVMIRVGEHDVELDALAAALTKAGAELQALVAPKRTVDTTPYASGERRTETVEVRESEGGAELVPAPLPGEALLRDRGGAFIERVYLTGVQYLPPQLGERFPRVVFEGRVIEKVTE